MRRVTTKRLFLSCASHEFRTYRDFLAASLAKPGVELRRQEDFIGAGQTTLEKLNEYIRTCDAVIHLCGDAVGSYPKPAEIQAVLRELPDFAAKLDLAEFMQPPGLSFTQWEAWLALYHRKSLALYRAANVAQREPGFVRDPKQIERQQKHWKLLESLGRDRKEFVSPHDLSIEVLRALDMLVPGFVEHQQLGQARDRNLLFAVLALQDDILARDSFIRVCKLWAEDSAQSIAEVMLRERLLTEEDRALVEARLARKLKARKGDIRQSLADCLGTDAKNSLAEALDPDSFASLPDRLAGVGGLGDASAAWRYKLTRTHGVGGLGVVSVATDSALDRSVALKQLKPDRLLDPMAIERFIREARITGRLQHPNIVPVYELGLTPEDQVPFYAMRFVGHRTLHDAILHHYTDKSASAADRNIRFCGLIQSFLAVCNAVAFAHEQKVIHRDIKPANVMIGDFGEVILLDWGLAKRTDEPEPTPLPDINEEQVDPVDTTKTRAGVKLGSPAYMAPEQAAGRIDEHAPHTDIYGLGATLYEVLTGDVPFTGTTTEELLDAIEHRKVQNPRERNRLVPAALTAICVKAMAKLPSDRYATAQAFADDIQHWLADEPVDSYSEPVLARVQRVARKHPGPTSALAATILVGLIGVTVGLVVVNGEKENTRRALADESKALKEVEAQRTRAEDNFVVARTTVNEFVTEINSNELSVVPGVQELRKAMALKARNQNEAFAASRLNDPEVLADLAESRINYAQVLLSVGPVEAALAEAAKGVSELETASASNSSYSMRYRLAKGLSDMGDIYWDLDQFKESQPLNERAIALLETLHSENLTDTKVTFELARSLNRLGTCKIEQIEKIAAYERSRTLSSSILATYRPEAQVTGIFAAATFNLGRCYSAPSDRERKRQLLLQAAESDKRALALTPNAPKAVSNASLGLVEQGALLADMGNLDEAGKMFELAEKTGRDVVEQNPKVTRFQWLLASTLKRKAEFHTKVGEFAQAKEYYKEAVNLLESTVNKSDDRPQYAETLIEIRDAIATFHSGTPATGGTRDDLQYRLSLDEAVKTARQCNSKFPRSLAIKHLLATSIRNRASFANEELSWDDGLRLANESCDIYDTIVFNENDSKSLLPEFIEGYARSLSLLSEIHHFLGNENEVKAAADKSLLLLPHSEVNGIISISNNLTRWGEACFEDERFLDASIPYIKAADAIRPILEKYPQNFYLRMNLAKCLHDLRLVYRNIGDGEKEIDVAVQLVEWWVSPILGRKKDIDRNQKTESVLADLSTIASMRRTRVYKIPIKSNGLIYLQDVVIVDALWPKDPLEDLAKCHASLGLFEIPSDVRESIRKLQQIAHDNNVSFLDLCDYALNKGSKGATVLRTSKDLQRQSQVVAKYEKLYSASRSRSYARLLARAMLRKATIQAELGDLQLAGIAVKASVSFLLAQGNLESEDKSSIIDEFSEDVRGIASVVNAESGPERLISLAMLVQDVELKTKRSMTEAASIYGLYYRQIQDRKEPKFAKTFFPSSALCFKKAIELGLEIEKSTDDNIKALWQSKDFQSVYRDLKP